jgi:GTP-binding protein HflX
LSAPERFILAGVYTENAQISAEDSLGELEELTETLGARAVGRITQSLTKPHPAHYLGKGKLAELKELIEREEADGVICDDELSSAQYRNMEEALGAKVIDRTVVILEIFARNARSAEGIAQTELAQLQYRLSRLSGRGAALSRLGGGIGTRGPGETKLETDRRRIREKLASLKERLGEIAENRAVLRGKRERAGETVFSLAGYTNAGKSTLMNLLTGAGADARDALFATLGTTTRRFELPSGGGALLTDTVGFIRKLPHHLIKAFSATLEELRWADVLIHVADLSSPVMEAQAEVVRQTLDRLGLGGKPVITVYNKVDLKRTGEPVRGLEISAKTGQGRETLLEAMEAEARKLRRLVTALIPYDAGALLNAVHIRGEIVSEEFREDGVMITAHLPADLAAWVAK